METLIRAFDWATTPLGPVTAWSPALRMMVPFILANRFPMMLWWGPDYVSFYNDAYRPILGDKHPWALGRPVRECWSEIWDVLKPLIDTPFRGGASTWNDDIALELNRSGFTEETHFTIAYSPVPDETAPGGIGGVLATVHEITGKVVAERRVGLLRDLGAGRDAKTAEEACVLAAGAIERYPKDVPFALFFLVDADGDARLAGSAGVPAGSPALDPAAWPLAEAIEGGTLLSVGDLARRFGGAVPRGPWTDPPVEAVLASIRSNLARGRSGVLVAAVSARLKLDDGYRAFISLIAGQTAAAVDNARAYEEERRRAEALAEIDRAKTVFFSNVSHEFRTPLTLMLGPLEDALADKDLSPAHRERLQLVHRNGGRLLKLVNALLDFSRIEAGRVEASFEPVDLAALTRDLAGVFRSAVEKAGLRLVLDCPPLPEKVYVDKEMWEKIVLNLLSNALKFTFEGEITVSLSAAGSAARLTVRDSGVGIPPEELPRVFERFHRVENARARTHEGTGIGLSLVQELARLHGGAVRAESEPGKGAAFIVEVPLGAAHVAPDRIKAGKTLASTAGGAFQFLEEAERWLSDGARPPDAAAGGPLTDVRILLADDNADMREYLASILSPHWAVESVPDGAAALAAVRRSRPDLVLSDVMMPGLDGFALIQELRADPATRDVPVILLSARAGEESRVEGLDAGADDYLVKPFSARELVARVNAQIRMARLRKLADRTLRAHAEELSRHDLAAAGREAGLKREVEDLRRRLAQA